MKAEMSHLHHVRCPLQEVVVPVCHKGHHSQNHQQGSQIWCWDEDGPFHGRSVHGLSLLYEYLGCRFCNLQSLQHN